MTEHFTWIPIYQELAEALAGWQGRQAELIAFLEDLRTQGYVISPLTDKDEEGSPFLLNELDPFTFFGVFNRGIKDEQRVAILGQMKRYFNLQSPLPVDFTGVPILNNMKSWFIAYQPARDARDVERLWRVFQLALGDDPLQQPELRQAFDAALAVKYTNVNLTMGLFWIRPDTFLNLDQTNRAFLKIKLPSEGLTAQFYFDTLQTVRAQGKPFPQLSYEAWLAKKAPIKPPLGEAYWLVGAYWNDRDPADQTERFLEEGIWENGYLDRYLDEVKTIKVGDKIAIKAAFTQRRDLPFNARNKTVSRMDIKAIGTVVANRMDGRAIEVEWERDFTEKSWYFYTNRNTVWHLRTEKDYTLRKYADRLIRFVWYGEAQDYDWFCQQWWGPEDTSKPVSPDSQLGIAQPYDIEDMIASGVFLTAAELTQILDRLSSKKALILQGAPGVGKTFIARRLAYALMKEVSPGRLEMVQFHQSYSYDDFVRGFRPLPGQAGSFGLQNGVFYDFCQKAVKDPDREYVFIIDEINRGNLSQIFGELLMLIEADKRGTEFALPLVYRQPDEPRFYIPQNVYLIGLMNIADRSLAMVDYALRRRFAFVTLKPQYERPLFQQWLHDRKMTDGLIQLIVTRLTTLNQEIRDDPLLGDNYQIGHSYFCPKGDNFAGLDTEWYRSIVRTEIVPLLQEYWFDNPQKVVEAERRLLA